MRIILAFVVAFVSFFALSTGKALATDCNTNCHDRCRRCAFGVCVIEPSCHLTCEAEKKLACAAGASIPHVPTPTEMGTNPQAACGAPFESFVQPVIAYCANWNGRADNLYKIEEAKRALTATGILNWDHFNNTDIRWCPINGSGFAPQPGRILLHPNLQGDRVELAAVLGHEMKHMFQWREMGENGFKCGYSRELLAGRGQGRSNAIERPAYEFEDSIRQRISAYYNQMQSTPVPQPFPQQPFPQQPLPQPMTSNRCGTPQGACYTATYAPIGNPCWCSSQWGPVIGRTF